MWCPLEQEIEYVANAKSGPSISYIQPSESYSTWFALYVLYAPHFASILFFILVSYLPSHSIRGGGFSPWFHSYFPASGYKQQSSCLRRVSTQISIITTAKPAKLGALTLRKPLLRLHKYTHSLSLSLFLCLCLCGFISGFSNQLGHF